MAQKFLTRENSSGQQEELNGNRDAGLQDSDEWLTTRAQIRFRIASGVSA